MPSFPEVQERLRRVKQEHLLLFIPRIVPERQGALLAQIDALELEALPGLIETYVLNTPALKLPTDLQPSPYYPFDASAPARPWDRPAATAAGEALIRAGKVAAFVVAGGQGSRLGVDGPKGCVSAGAVTGKSLFQIFAENLLGARDRYGVEVPWYIMTSPLNHAATVGFFTQHAFFGLNPGIVKFFPQGVMPSLDIRDGKVLLAAQDEVATNPDGHGGCVRALHVSGALDDMHARGIQHLSYFQVDNPSVRVIDPAFIGLHASGADSSGEMSSKMVVKASPEEKVGVFCRAGGRTRVLEYSDLPPSLTNERDTSGRLRYNAGSIAIHMLSVEFLTRLATNPSFSLPYHRAEKKVACVDLTTGNVVTPTQNNAVKLEKFVFDALELATNSIVLETDRVEEFAPIKNATGADSIETSKQLQTLRAARWLETRGVSVPKKPDGTPNCTLEISARTATTASEIPASKLPSSISPGATLAI